MRGLPGTLMYVPYEELRTEAWCIQDPVGFLGNYGPKTFGDREYWESVNRLTPWLSPGAGLVAWVRATSV